MSNLRRYRLAYRGLCSVRASDSRRSYLVLERFGQSKQLPGNSTKSVKFRRFNALSSAVTELVEGVTPSASRLP